MIRTLAIALLTAAGACRSAGPALLHLPPGQPAIFNDAFTAGHTAQVRGRPLTFQHRLIGTFKLPSGQLVACDPFWCDEEYAWPFARQVPPGEYPLHLAIARFRNGDERVAFARLTFSREPAVRWEMAVAEAHEVETLRRGEILGYPVDAGTGAFMDAQAWRAFTERRQRGEEAFYDSLDAELDRTYAPTRSWLLMDAGPGSVALFSSGFGDGHYATYWGFDARGNLVAALTDFYVVHWAHPNEKPLFDVPAGLPPR